MRNSDTHETTATTRHRVGHEVQEASTFTAQFDAAKAALAGQLDDAAQRVKALSPKSGALARVGTSVQGSLSNTERYLRSHSATDLVSDFTTVVQRYPLPFVLGAIGVAIGILVTGRTPPRPSAARGSVKRTARSTTATTAH